MMPKARSVFQRGRCVSALVICVDRFRCAGSVALSDEGSKAIVQHLGDFRDESRLRVGYGALQDADSLEVAAIPQFHSFCVSVTLWNGVGRSLIRFELLRPQSHSFGHREECGEA